jgi:hypothetical protein
MIMKKKNEIMELSINWNDGRFEHTTLFSFENNDAMQNVNIARNGLIRLINSTIPVIGKPTKYNQISRPVEKEYSADEAQKKIEAWQRLLTKGLITQTELDKRKNELKIKK